MHLFSEDGDAQNAFWVTAKPCRSLTPHRYLPASSQPDERLR